MNGLDADGLRSFREMLLGIHREYGATIVLSSHQLDEIDQVATHIGILSQTDDALFEGTRAQLSERIPQHLLIKVDRRADALAILEQAGFTVDARQEHLTIHSATTETARELNRVLVMRGIGVFHLSVEVATLERQFQKVLATARVWDRV